MSSDEPSPAPPPGAQIEHPELQEERHVAGSPHAVAAGAALLALTRAARVRARTATFAATAWGLPPRRRSSPAGSSASGGGSSPCSTAGRAGTSFSGAIYINRPGSDS